MMSAISEKIELGERISDQDALWLFERANLVELGQLANHVNLRKNGKAVYYNINRHINPTNICALSCKFCAYSKKIGEEGGYAYEIDEMIKKAGEAVSQGATELHMVGGLHPRWPFQRYVDMIAAMHQAYPEVHLKAFTAVELDWMARRARKTIAEVMKELKAAGLGSFPGGGAEIFHPEVRDQICDTKVSGEQWIDTHRTAHNLGLRSNCTMLYGHIENYAHRVDHMRRLRELQDETGGFNVFIPLAFQPFQNEMGINRYTFGSDDLRTIAVARLYLDNFKNIKSYWVMLGQDIAQLALQFGANDLDGTVIEEKISRAAGGRAGMIMTRANLESLIRRSDRTPVERTTLYQPVLDEDRAHLVPISGDETETELQSPLQNLSTESDTNAASILALATRASLHKIASVLRLNQKNNTDTLPFENCVLIELDNTNEVFETENPVSRALIKVMSNVNVEDSLISAAVINCDQLDVTTALKLLRTPLKGHALGLNVFALGLAWIFELPKVLNLSLTEIMSDLKVAGLAGVIESTRDADRIDQASRWNLIDAANAVNLKVIPSLSLKERGGQPDWAAWSDELVKFRTRFRANPFTTSVSIQVAAGSTIMPSEYLKGLALARLAIPSPCQICTPLMGFPTLSPQRGLGATDDQHPIMKLVSTLADFGSDGLGLLPINLFNWHRVCEDIMASGRSPDAKLTILKSPDTQGDLSQRLGSLKHIPAFAADV